jgi:hypothetical protein
MADLMLKMHATDAILEWLSQGFDKNWQSNLQEPYVMLSVFYPVAMDMPDDVMAWAERHQAGPASEPRFTLPAGILAKYALGEPIPPREEY